MIIDNFKHFSPNLEADLAKCSKDSSRQAIVSITYIRLGFIVRSMNMSIRKILKICVEVNKIFFFFRFYVFWCVNFNLVIVEVKITIITISFGLTTPQPQTTPVKNEKQGKKIIFHISGTHHTSTFR